MSITVDTMSCSRFSVKNLKSREKTASFASSKNLAVSQFDNLSLKPFGLIYKRNTIPYKNAITKFTIHTNAMY